MKLLVVTLVAMAVFSKDFTAVARDNGNEPVKTAEVQQFHDIAGNSFNGSKLVYLFEEDAMVRRRRKSLCRRTYNGYCVKRRKPCPSRFPLQTAPNKPLCSKFHRCCYQVDSECTTDMVSIGSEFYKVFTDDIYNWTAAGQKCFDEGLVMAEPREDPQALVGYLDDNYGFYFWLGAREDGTTYVWNSGNVLSNTSPYWTPSYPGTYVTTDYCLRSTTRTDPYYAVPCSWRKYVICQCAY